MIYFTFLLKETSINRIIMLIVILLPSTSVSCFTDYRKPHDIINRNFGADLIRRDSIGRLAFW